MRVNINAWCTYKETYSLKITKEYLKQLNEWMRDRYPKAECEDITAEDVYAAFNMRYEDYPDKLKIKLDNFDSIYDFIIRCVREDAWEYYVDSEYISTNDYETEVEFDTEAERERFEGSNRAE